MSVSFLLVKYLTEESFNERFFQQNMDRQFFLVTSASIEDRSSFITVEKASSFVSYNAFYKIMM